MKTSEKVTLVMGVVQVVACVTWLLCWMCG